MLTIRLCSWSPPAATIARVASEAADIFQHVLTVDLQYVLNKDKTVGIASNACVDAQVKQQMCLPETAPHARYLGVD